MVQCCKCNGSTGVCLSCSCAKAGRACIDCLPGKKKKCCNSRRQQGDSSASAGHSQPGTISQTLTQPSSQPTSQHTASPTPSKKLPEFLPMCQSPLILNSDGTSTKPRVAVVGGGLVGSLQTLFLAKRGFQVDLYEKRGDIRKMEQAEGRSINLALSIRGREALRAVGLEDVVLANALPMYSRMIHSPSGKLSSQAYGRRDQCIYSVDRLNMNKLLLSCAESNPNVNLHFDRPLLRADLKEKVLTFHTGSSGGDGGGGADGGVGERSQQDVKVDFIFGCDGVFSTVRRQMMRWGSMNYSQEVIEHGYKELCMPATIDGDYAMDPRSLHIWPRGEFMMIALPNQDRSFTVTLFMPFKVFHTIETEEDLLAFFMKHFKDSVEKIGVNKLVGDYFSNPIGSVPSVKCRPHFMADSTVILGDAAHAVVPFYGQGMNAGFEDCLIFDKHLAKLNHDLALAGAEYSKTHWRDSHAIADLSMYNYIEMRSRVTSRFFIFRKYIDKTLHYLFPNLFIPLYSMVAFTRIPYHQVVVRNERQERFVNVGLFIFKVGAVGFTLSFLYGVSGIHTPLRYRILPCVLSCLVNEFQLKDLFR